MFLTLLVLSILVTFAISSMWLYSPGPEKVREWWLQHTGYFAPLAYCQLCCSFWIGLFICSVLFPFPLNVICAFACSGMSWMLGAITNFFLWGRAIFEEMMKD